MKLGGLERIKQAAKKGGRAPENIAPPIEKNY